MMTVTLLDPTSLLPTPDFATFDFIHIEYSPEAVATEHPVEQGVAVTDHVQRRAYRFATEIMVTSSPLSVFPQPFAVEDAVGFVERAVGLPATIVIDGEGTFSPFILEGAPHSRTMSQGRPFVLRWKQLRIASALSVVIPPRMPAPVAQVGAPTEVNLGQQSSTPGVPTSKLLNLQQSAAGLVKSVL
jgi:Dit-like tail protein